ncbi:MAG: hypothetical protein KDC49_18750 [Saprospiraceae bacterium]|nr:hypothetical protein [Saprospiraceae bacterium]
MEQKHIELVQSSFQHVIPIADTAMEIFYSKLFERNPDLIALFPKSETGMGAQRNKLRDMLVAAVNGLSDIPALVPVLQSLGKRHVSYGVEDKHYDDVGAALIGTLEAGLGEAFTPDVKDAWVKVYGVMSSTMITAANEVEPAPVKKWYEVWK